MKLPNVIIGGTEKAGTTSVFGYLALHPQVSISNKKETNFFRIAGGRPSDYAHFFANADDNCVLLEASPAYLGEAESVAPRIQAMLPDVKLLFILRDPIDRFLSSYHFHHGRLNLPQELSFHEYLLGCLSYADDTGNSARESTSIDEWFLKVLTYGRYAGYLRHYFALFPRESVRVAFYDDLRDGPEQFMRQLSTFLGIDPDFWATASFERRNVTFSGRHKWLHRIALSVNSHLERVWLRQPELKARLLRLYQSANRAAPVVRILAPRDRALLESFYACANQDLESLLGFELPSGWCKVPSPTILPIEPGRVASTELSR